MKLIIRSLQLLLIIVLLYSTSCKKEECPSDMPASSGYGKTQFVNTGDFRVAFDFMGRKGHDEMIKGFNLGRNVMRNSDKFVLITVMNKVQRKLVMDAAVNVSIMGPSGKTQSCPAKAVMGGGMHHYVSGFMTPEMGDYSVVAAIKAGGDTIQAKTNYRKE